MFLRGSSAVVFDFTLAEENAKKGDPVSQIYLLEKQRRDNDAKLSEEIADLKIGLGLNDKKRMEGMYRVLYESDKKIEQRARRLASNALNADRIYDEIENDDSSYTPF